MRVPDLGVRNDPVHVDAVHETARLLTDLGHDVREVDPHYPDPTLAFVPATISGSYGSLVLQPNGQWTYTLDVRAEPLTQGQIVTEPITVTLTDGSTRP